MPVPEHLFQKGMTATRQKQSVLRRVEEALRPKRRPVRTVKER